MLEKPNLLIAGASGGVANALLHHMTSVRDLFGKLILLDRNNKVLRDIYLDHERLKYEFLEVELMLPDRVDEYHRILREHAIDIVLDITDMDSLPFIEATNDAAVSYVNTGMNDEKLSIEETVIRAFEKKESYNKAPHILCSGMNPGNVNMWVRYGIYRFGVPNEIIHFEYDTSKFVRQWHPMMTWSVHEFLVECVRDTTGKILGRGREKVEQLLPNALEHRKNMHAILSPIMKFDKYPDGMITMHEECVSIGNKYDIPSQFVYAVHPKTMDLLVKIYEKKGNVSKDALELGNNTSEMLDGADNIGVALEYKDKRVYYFNTIPSVAIIGTNATFTQVIVGVFAALNVLISDELQPGAYFPEDLFDTCYRHFVFDNMRVQEFVFQKGRNEHLKLKSFNPMLKSHKTDHYRHLYII
ncbi:hypothetical protein C4556_00965 [Candidatus Parcubacteria bacterium]|nr:MAG: hypothetical protein C4556_00965 [Candidatus Parcubacteria bacterium]